MTVEEAWAQMKASEHFGEYAHDLSRGATVAWVLGPPIDAEEGSFEFRLRGASAIVEGRELPDGEWVDVETVAE